MGHVGAVNRSVYCLTKHALEGLTKAMALELAPHGIRVVSIAPTFVETPMTRDLHTQPGVREERTALTPLGRLAMPEDIAWGILYLASDESSYVTGSELVIDGGVTAR